RNLAGGQQPRQLLFNTAAEQVRPTGGSAAIHQGKGTRIMRMRTKFGGTMLALAALATTACTTDPVTGEKKISKAAIGALGGAALGAGAGALVGGRHSR